MSENAATDPKKVFPNAKDRIVEAFNLNGVQYYEFYDFNKVPCIRGFYALTYFNELKMRCTREYLVAHTQAIREAMIIDGRKMDIGKIALLNQQMAERLEFVLEPNIAYKLSTVVFFDATENPYEYDMKYNLEKTKIFRDAPVDAFFLSQPIVKLMPFIPKLESDLPTYFETVQQINLKHLENLLSSLSKESTKKDWFKSLTLLRNEISAHQKSS